MISFKFLVGNKKCSNYFYHLTSMLLLSYAVFCIGTTNADAKLLDEPIKPIPLKSSLDERKVNLGNRLFHEKRLSGNNKVACVSCHVIKLGGTDRTKYSIGINNQVGVINSPTIFNSKFNFRQFWDGRASNLIEQAAVPVHNPIEMGSNWKEVIAKLKKDKAYVETFSLVYKDGMQPKNIQDAIAVFEESLTTPNSRFDQYLRGNKTALTGEELHGYELFKSYGCIACHQGVNVGGNMYQKFGVLNEYFEKRGDITTADYGLYNVTKDNDDKHVFKVPSLRVAALTAPYFHDGSVETLRDAVEVMFEHQLGRSGTDEEKDAIVKFLHTLVGEIPNVEVVK